MKAMAVGPFDSEVLLDEGGAVAVDGLGELCSVTFALPAGMEPLHLLLKRAVYKCVESVGAIVQVVGGTAADDDALEAVLASMPLRVWRTDEITALSPHPNDPGRAG